MTTLLDPEKIRIDLDIQSRVSLNEETVKEYAELMERGIEFPPPRVFHDEVRQEYILVDGFHRLAAHRIVKPHERIAVEIEPGTAIDAKWASIGSNKDHGLQRTNADKRKATEDALLHPKGCEMSNVKVAEHVGVHECTVRRIRSELESSSALPKIENRIVKRGSQVYSQNSSKIGNSSQDLFNTCNQCRYFSDEICEADGSSKLAWDIACEDFLIAVEEPPPRDIPPPDYDNIVPYEITPRGPKTKKLHKNRDLKNCVTVHLPSNNPQLFAVELRDHWEPEYLMECFKALKYLLEDDQNEQNPL